MSHRTVQSLWEIKKGTTIEYREGHWLLNGQEQTEWGEILLGEFQGHECGCLRIKIGSSSRLIPAEWYVASLMISPDLLHAAQQYRKKLVEQGMTAGNIRVYVTMFIESWAVCEKYYGIDQEGSTPTDVRREVAFKILKGDPMMLDLASDIMGR